MDTLSQRLMAEAKSVALGREYTNIKYSASGSHSGLSLSPLARSSLSLASLGGSGFQASGSKEAERQLQASRGSGKDSGRLPRPPDETPRAFYENMGGKERGDSAVLPDLNIGPPPNFAPPIPPSKK